MECGGGAECFANAVKLNKRTHWQLFCHGEMENGKQLLRVGPDTSESEAGRNGEANEPFLRVLVRKLRNDFFAAREMKLFASDMNRLSRLANEVHLDATVALVVNRPMPPERKIEVCAELAVRPNEKIQIEFRGHARAIVVGAFENVPVLLQIDAD